MPWNGIHWTNRKARSWYTTAEVAQLIGVTAETVRDWVAAGKLKAERSPGGGRLRFAAGDLTRWLGKRAAA